MGQKVNPIGFRLGVYRDWDARWFARKSYGLELLEDISIRNYLNRALENAEIARVEIEKSVDSVRIILHSGRSGVVIGKRGQEIEALKNDLASLLKKKNIEISVQEVKSPELNATLVAKNIADQLVKRASFKKVMKRAALSAIKSWRKGYKDLLCRPFEWR